MVLNESTLEPTDTRFHHMMPATSVIFESPREVLKHVLSSVGHTAVVYPTEMYYYFRFPLGPRIVSGNIRFVDAVEGGISIGYFDADNNRDVRYSEFKDGDPGVVVRSVTPDRVFVSLDGIPRTFVLDQGALAKPAGLTLLPGEKFISGIRDESGYFLSLIYFEPERSFYYLVNRDRPLPEDLHPGRSTLSLWFGEQSRFCFFEHSATGRLVLVGVLARNIEMNNWYDGPFDQVPPRLGIRSILEEAYPYVKLDAGGIDEHGNFLRMNGQRVAISPYRAYSNGPEVEKWLATALALEDPTPSAWIKATYEYKRDWRASSLPPEFQFHSVGPSASWPANHWGRQSSTWPSAHMPSVSLTWPPSHKRDSSESISTDAPAGPPRR